MTRLTLENQCKVLVNKELYGKVEPTQGVHGAKNRHTCVEKYTKMLLVVKFV